MAAFRRICTASARRAYDSGEIELYVVLSILAGDLDQASGIRTKLLASYVGAWDESGGRSALSCSWRRTATSTS